MPNRNVADDASNTDKATPTIADRLPLIDAATNPDSLKEVTLENLMKLITGLTADTAPDFDADYLTTYDASASAVKKVLLKTANRIVQAVHTQTGAVATGTTILPVDDTIPQNTEGDQYMTLAITPTSATNKLIIEMTVFAAHSAVSWISAALFQDTTANALAVGGIYATTATGGYFITFKHEMTAGTTSATTFKVRIGGNAVGTTTFNGTSGGRLFGGVMASSIRIEEVKV